MKIIEPGAIRSDFIGRSFDFANDESLAEYQPTVRALLGMFENMSDYYSPAEECAEVIYAAITDGSDKMRYPAAGSAEQFLAMREGVSDENFFAQIKGMMNA